MPVRKKLIRSIFLVLSIGFYVWFSSAMLVFVGPFSALREYVVGAFATSRHGYLLLPLSFFTVSASELKRHSGNLMNTTQDTFTSEKIAEQDFGNINDPSIRLETYKGPTFTANVMLIRDPKRVRVATTKYLGDVGQTVSAIVEENGAVAGINGGAFKDTKWQGTGGLPLGITIVNGKVVDSDIKVKQPVVALTEKGALIAGAYTLPELQALHVTQALSFGPVLVQNGQDIVQGDGGWGYAPRTAIGQASDGTIIFVVTDGRFIHGPNNLGASLKDIAQLMLHYGAEVAANLDGGSSTTMVYHGKLVNQPTDILGERQVATAFIVMPEKEGGH
jgi:exopolysaccharide biosynthesis protein